MKRRTFVATGLAMAGFAHPLMAQDSSIPDYGMPEDMLPVEVDLAGDFPPFEVHVIPSVFSLFWTLPENRAIRYKVGIGREGLYEAGEFFVGAKKKWPSWTPTPDMIEREPEKYGKYEDGLPGGLDNPLGSRALYLFTPEKGDTFLRIHGTNEPETIGKRVSNGCARLVNDQIIDLYDRVPIDTRVLLYPVV